MGSTNKTALAKALAEGKQYRCFEQDRRASFKSWPFNKNDSCNVNKMAEAGFYWCGNDDERDTASCFVCDKQLDGWEATDDPWDEHRRHAPQCNFAKLSRPESQLTIDEFLTLVEKVAHMNARKEHAAICKMHNELVEKSKLAIIEAFNKKKYRK